MLMHPTLDQLRALRLEGMIEASEEQRRDPNIVDLDFEERLGLLVQRQWLWKSNRALAARLQQAQLKIPATLEDIDYRHPRGLKRAQIEQLRVHDWIGQHRACLITGPTGCGKTYLACALGHQACRDAIGARGTDRDTLAHSSDSQLEDGLDLTFLSENGVYSALTVPGITQGAFEVPCEGISVNNKMYIYHTTDHSSVVPMGRSVLAVSEDDGLNFRLLFSLSHRHFINLSVVKQPVSRWRGAPASSGEGVFLFGSGAYRQSNVRLAFQSADEIENLSTIRYLAGLDQGGMPTWSSTEMAAVSLFQQPCVGELSVAYNPVLRRWIMSYNCEKPRGIHVRTARFPWGPWSSPQIIFDPWLDGGYCHFIHTSRTFQNCDTVHDPGRENEWGGEYGPYWFKDVYSGTSDHMTLYFTLSTWNPYTVILMETKLRMPNADVATVAEDSSNNPIDVLTNDMFAPDIGETLRITAVSDPKHGTAAFTATGITYTPDGDYFGPDSFTYTINDGNSGSATMTVAVMVTDANDNPTANADAATVAEDSSNNSINVLANDMFAPDSGETLRVTAVSDPPNGTATFTPSGVTYTPDANYFGTATFTYTIGDGNGGTATATATIRVNSINDQPSFTDSGNQSVLEDPGEQSVVNWASAINPGAANESGQVLTFHVTANSKPGLFAIAPQINASTGTLTYTPAANVNGNATIDIILEDNGGMDNDGMDRSTTHTFTIMVSAVNDAPMISGLANQTIDEDATLGPLSFTITDLETPGNDLAVEITSNNPDLVPPSSIVRSGAGQDRTVAINPLPNKSGVAQITITVS